MLARKIAIKVFGQDLSVFARKIVRDSVSAERFARAGGFACGQQGLIPQLKIHIMRDQAAGSGISAGEITQLAESAFAGHTVAQVIEDQKFFDLFYRFDEASRLSSQKMGEMVIKTMPNGERV